MNIIENWKNYKNSGYSSDLYIKTSGKKGLGVFAKNDIKKDDVIEYCHCMVLGFRENYHKDPVIFQYAYPGDDEVSDEWANHGRKFLIPLGFGGIYNSSETQNLANAAFKTHTNESLLVFYALKDIKKDEEVLVWWSTEYYNYFIKNKLA
jgi:SET domain-containing protein